METFKKDKQGLYFQGQLKAVNYDDAIKELYDMETIPSGFMVCTDEEANDYSVIDQRGVQHIYELSPEGFYDALMSMDEWN